jgi:hypothetical protein
MIVRNSRSFNVQLWLPDYNTFKLNRKQCLENIISNMYYFFCQLKNIYNVQSGGSILDMKNEDHSHSSCMVEP